MPTVGFSCRSWIILSSVLTFTSCCDFLAVFFFFDSSAVVEKILFEDQTLGPQSFPRFCCKPAPIHLCSHDPLWEWLITLPPSYFDLICIHPSAILVVSLLMILLRDDWPLFECREASSDLVYLVFDHSIVGLSATVSFHSLSCTSTISIYWNKKFRLWHPSISK